MDENTSQFPTRKKGARTDYSRALFAIQQNVYPDEDVDSVLSIIHELVYTIIHENVRSRKEQSTSDEGTATAKKWDDTL